MFAPLQRRQTALSLLLLGTLTIPWRCCQRTALGMLLSFGLIMSPSYQSYVQASVLVTTGFNLTNSHYQNFRKAAVPSIRPFVPASVNEVIFGASQEPCPTITLPESLPTTAVNTAYSASVAVVSPTGNYWYSIIAGELSTFDLNNQTGSITGTGWWRTNHTFTVRATDTTTGCYTDQAYILRVICPPVTFLPPQDGKVGEAYEGRVNVQGGNVSYYVSMNDQELPEGLLSDGNYIYGTPTKAGTYRFMVNVGAEFENCSASGRVTIKILPATSPCPAVTLPESIPKATIKEPYSTFLTASPAGTYTYRLVAGELDPYLTLDTQTGELKGMVDFKTMFTFAVRATDASGCFGERTYVFESNCPIIAFTQPPNGKVGAPYSFSAAIASGLTSYFIATASDSLPAGLQVEADGVTISGTPTKAGTYRINLIAIDEFAGCITPGTITITIEQSSICTSSGTILRETWVKAKGYDVRQIPVNTPPTATRLLTRFEGPSDVTNTYGDRISGSICPPMFGKYVFWIASDDNSALYLSSDDQTTNKRRIAWVNGWTEPREWNKFASQQSIPIYLEAGKQYYIETLHKEAYGHDHIAVGWQLPDGTLEKPIPGNYLSPASPQSTRLIDLEQPSTAEASLSASPNPFSDQTTIHFRAKALGKANVAVYDMHGNLVKVLFDGELEEGETKEIILEGKALPSGVYLIKAIEASQSNYLKLVFTQ